MTQVSPTVLLYAQALALLDQMTTAAAAGTISNINDISFQLKRVMSQFELGAGTPLLQFDPVVEGEPPLSAKINQTWTTAELDVNILQDQLDVLRAASVFTHNYMAMETQLATFENGRVSSKLNTLQLYSDSTDAKLSAFSDQFANPQFVDTTRTDPTTTCEVQDGFLRLGQQGPLTNLSTTATITTLPNSNGFWGNNQEIEDPTTATVDPVSGEKLYRFLSDTNAANNIASLVDGDPTTWIEYEHYAVRDSDRTSAFNFNFTYDTTETNSTARAGQLTAGRTIGVTNSTNSRVDWAAPPTPVPGGVQPTLQLGLQFDFGAVQTLNYISYIPYGLEQNNNFPVHIKSLSTSTDGTVWTAVQPTPLWLGTNANLQTAQTADNVVIGSAGWSFESRLARYVQIIVEQPNPINCNIGHLYYTTKTSGVRVEGPIPSLSNPEFYNNVAASSLSTMTQHREYFRGLRWGIGIRDLSLMQIQYQPTSTMISQLIQVGGIIDRVALSAEIFIPPEFDSSQNWVQFFISPDDGRTWHQISRIEDNSFNLPEVIAFNNPLPTAFQESGVTYYSSPGDVTTLRLKIQLSRPSTTFTSTPLIRSYKLKIRRR